MLTTLACVVAFMMGLLAGLALWHFHSVMHHHNAYALFRYLCYFIKMGYNHVACAAIGVCDNSRRVIKSLRVFRPSDLSYCVNTLYMLI